MEPNKPSHSRPLPRYVTQGLEIRHQNQLRAQAGNNQGTLLSQAGNYIVDFTYDIRSRLKYNAPQNEPTSNPEYRPTIYNARAKAFYPAPQGPGLYAELINAQLAAPQVLAKGGPRIYSAYVENLPPTCSIKDLLGCVERAADVDFCELSPPNENRLSCCAEIRFSDQAALKGFLVVRPSMIDAGATGAPPGAISWGLDDESQQISGGKHDIFRDESSANGKAHPPTNSRPDADT
ncbi:hypothetical protein F5X99DRAFT_410792 [Biscogniauxia marginata]|nr:hypothetical protein F5X99DRAFT_410792 [Biscogniauxia marginata]